jgi:hypothetical protein
MFVVREIDRTISPEPRVVLVTQEIVEAVNHFHTEGFAYITEVLATYLFSHTDGRTASLSVEDVTA